MEVELDPLTLLEMGMGEDNIEIEVMNKKCFVRTGLQIQICIIFLSLHPDPHLSEKLDPDLDPGPHLSKNLGTVEVQKWSHGGRDRSQ